MVSTRRSGLLGRGIGYTLSPPMHEQQAARAGVRLTYEVLDADELALADDAVVGWVRTLPSQGYCGINVTVPFKQTVLPAMDRLSEEAELLQAVNTVVVEADGTLVGHNTDSRGFALALDGLPATAATAAAAEAGAVVQLGAGGAGAAVLLAVLERGTREVVLVDPDRARAEQLAVLVAERHPARVRPSARTDLAGLLAGDERVAGVVNASPVGSPNHPGSPLDDDEAALLHPGQWVADVNYVPLRTPLLEQAARAGAATLDGGHMLVHQAALSYTLFTGLPADPAAMRRTLEEEARC